MADPQPNMQIVSAARSVGDAVIVAVRGEIDLHNSPELRTALLDILDKLPTKKLVLNLALVPYMDSSGVAVLVESLQRLRRVSGRVILTDLQPRVKGLLEIARLDSIFVLAANEADAVKK